MSQTNNYTLPLMFPVVRNQRTVYVMYSQVLESPDLQREVIARALAEMHDWIDRYGDLIRIVGDDRLRYLIEGLEDFREDVADLWPDNPAELLCIDDE